MSWMRPLGTTGLTVSALGLGTVKLGRNQDVKYPSQFNIPDDRQALALLARARELGINLIDTAPAYGNSEQRLGTLLKGQRDDWILCSKVGEEFEQGQSHFNFSPEHTVASVERSLSRMKVEAIDLVLVHSDGNDMAILDDWGTLEALAQLKQRGLIRAFGMSTKTIVGGIEAARRCDLVMLTYNLQQREEVEVLDACKKTGAGALIKKALASGHVANTGETQDPIAASMALVFSHPATSAAIIGTITPAHLEANVHAARQVVER